MKIEDYVSGAFRTEPSSEDYHKVRRRITSSDLTTLRVLLNRITHTSMQLDMWKKKVFYGSTKTRVLEEIEFAMLEHGYLAKSCESNSYTTKNLSNVKNLRILHGVVGIVGEAGELADAFGKFLKTGRLDEVNLKEELGDLEWYESIAVDALGTNHPDIWAANNRKLKERFPEKFTEASAQNRDVTKERVALETPKT